MAITTNNLNDMQSVLYMTDYQIFSKAWKEAGSTQSMAKHIWMKWKDIHNNDFLAEFGNMDLENKRVTAKALNILIENHKDKNKWNAYQKKAHREWAKSKESECHNCVVKLKKVV